MLSRNRVPLNRNNSFQNLLKKIGSRSDTMLLGNPCCLQTVSMKRPATLNAVNPVGRAPKCTPFKNLSTTTMMTVNPLEVGKLVMKSIERSSHTPSGAGKGCSSPAGRLWRFLFCWQVTHSLINLLTSY